MKISEVAKLLNYDVFGEDYEIDSITYAKEARESSIAVLFNKNDLEKTSAKVVLSEPKFFITNKSIIYCYESLEVAMIKIAKLLIEKNILPDYNKIIMYKNLKENVLCGENVVVGENSVIEPFTIIGNDVTIGDNCYIGSNVTIESGVQIGNKVTISSGCKIGAKAFYNFYDTELTIFSGIGTVIINDGVNISYNTVVERGTLSNTIIGKNTNLGHSIVIGHDVKIGSGCRIVSQTGICGNVIIGNNVTIFGQVGISNFVEIGDNTIVMAKSAVTKNVGKNKKVSGMFARNHMDELKMQAKLRKLVDKE